MVLRRRVSGLQGVFDLGDPPDSVDGDHTGLAEPGDSQDVGLVRCVVDDRDCGVGLLIDSAPEELVAAGDLPAVVERLDVARPPLGSVDVEDRSSAFGSPEVVRRAAKRLANLGDLFDGQVSDAAVEEPAAVAGSRPSPRAKEAMSSDPRYVAGVGVRGRVALQIGGDVVGDRDGQAGGEGVQRGEARRLCVRARRGARRA